MVTVEPPLRSESHRTFRRSEDVFTALACMRHGGTVSDVAERYRDNVREPISREAVETALWHLQKLKVVTVETQGDGRWWSVVRHPLAPSS